MTVFQFATGLTLTLITFTGVSGLAEVKSVCAKDAYGNLILKDGCVDIDQIAYESSSFSQAKPLSTTPVAAAKKGIARATASTKRSATGTQSVVGLNGGEGSSGSSGNDQLQSGTINYDQYVNNNAGQLDAMGDQSTVFFGKPAQGAAIGTTSIMLDPKVGNGSASK